MLVALVVVFACSPSRPEADARVADDPSTTEIPAGEVERPIDFPATPMDPGPDPSAVLALSNLGVTETFERWESPETVRDWVDTAVHARLVSVQEARRPGPDFGWPPGQLLAEFEVLEILGGQAYPEMARAGGAHVLTVAIETAHAAAPGQLDVIRRAAVGAEYLLFLNGPRPAEDGGAVYGLNLTPLGLLVVHEPSGRVGLPTESSANWALVDAMERGAARHPEAAVTVPVVPPTPAVLPPGGEGLHDLVGHPLDEVLARLRGVVGDPEVEPPTGPRR